MDSSHSSFHLIDGGRYWVYPLQPFVPGVELYTHVDDLVIHLMGLEENIHVHACRVTANHRG